jgi:hypothetical protein
MAPSDHLLELRFRLVDAGDVPERQRLNDRAFFAADV